MVNWEVFGRKRPWPNRDIIVAFALSDWGQEQNSSTKIAAFLSGTQSAFNCTAFPLQKYVRQLSHRYYYSRLLGNMRTVNRYSNLLGNMRTVTATPGC